MTYQSGTYFYSSKNYQDIFIPAAHSAHHSHWMPTCSCFILIRITYYTCLLNKHRATAGICLACLLDIVSFSLRWSIWFRWSRIYHRYQSPFTASIGFSLTECEFASVCAQKCQQRWLRPFPCIYYFLPFGSCEIFLSVFLL